MSGTKMLSTLRRLAGPKAVADGVSIPARYRARQLPLLLVVGVVGLLMPVLFTGAYAQGLLLTTLLYAILTLGFYWCFALAGHFTFAVSAFYGLGAYASVWAAGRFGGFWVGFVAAIVISGAVGGLMCIAFSRAKAIYFAIATVGLGSLAVIIFQYWTSFTGGYAGLPIQDIPSAFGFAIDTPTSQFYLVYVVLFLLLLITALFERSPASRDLALAREMGPVAATMGMRPRRLQLAAFVCGSAMQGLAGSLYAHTSTYISLDAFQLGLSLSALLMLLLGGMKSMYGPIVGAALLTYLPQLLRSQAEFADLIYGLLVLVVIVLVPNGITGLPEQLASGSHRLAKLRGKRS